MNVLDRVRQDFNIDENRIYILGQSMGGAGAIHLGIKYRNIWAAVGASAPAITIGHRPQELDEIPTMPMIILHGANDELIPVGRILSWVDEMKALGMPYEYHEIPGADHSGTIQRGAGLIFNFFNRHVRSN